MLRAEFMCFRDRPEWLASRVRGSMMLIDWEMQDACIVGSTARV